MTHFHVAIDHLASPDPDTPEPHLETTYLGTVDQAHVDEVRAIAALDDSPRWVKEHPRLEGAFMVLRDDGDLDVYVPVDAAEYRVYEPDPEAKTPGPDDLPRGASGPAYIDGAVRFGSQTVGGAMDTPGNPPRSTWHTTESPAGGNYFTSIAAYLIRVGAEPQVIYDPLTDKLGQFGPLTKSGRALRNDGTRRTNREGKVNIQVEVLGRASQPWTKGFDPAKKPNYRKLIAAMRAHGIPDVWPAGKPEGTAAAVAKGSRSRTTWQTKGGHYGHCHVPGNDHWDPGAIDTGIVPGKPAGSPADPGEGTGTQSGTGTYTVRKGDTLTSIAKAHSTTAAKLTSLNSLKDPDKLVPGQTLKVPAKKPTAPLYEPFPGPEFFHGGRNSKVITAMGQRLVAEGCGRYAEGPGPDWTVADRRSYAAWQKKYSKANNLGWTDADCNGIPGKASWDALRVPNV
ncbi:peptidoglycan-binding protein [Streptomyces caniscabiei]|uniref:peptidoglycan-binding protein n=1 Tax=Streptomyces caniscabiei TaxID=2746961 RepID=UPI003AF5259F